MTAALYERLMRALVVNGTVARELEHQLEPGASANGTAAYAGDFLYTAIRCLIVDMQREALELLAKADEWMSKALDRAATGEVIELQYRREFCHGICRWLLGPPAPPHDLTRACEQLRVSDEMARSDTRGNADFLDSSLSSLVFAEQYDECVAWFEQCGGKYPLPRGRRYLEAATAYLVARERLHPTLSESELEKQLHSFLKKRVPWFLKYARYPQFAIWVQLVTRAEAGAPARAAVRSIADRYA